MENIVLKTSKKELIETVKSINLDRLTKDELQKIAKAVAGDRLKAEFNFKIKESEFDIEKLLNEFYSLKNSPNTVKVYKKSIGNFLDWIGEQKIHPLNVTARTVDQYLIELNKTDYSGRSKHLLIAGIRAFYSYLVRYEIITVNPFKNIPALPKIERKRPLIIPKDSEVEKLKEYINLRMKIKGRGAKKARSAAKAMLIILNLLLETGLRVGAVSTITFHHDSMIKYRSKGKAGQKKISSKLYNDLKKINVQEWNVARIQRNFEVYCKNAGLPVFHPHSFRHYFSVNEYKKNKDIYRLKNLLGHASISITEIYLKKIIHL